MAPTATPPNLRPPAERTFVVAAIVLGAFALVQVIAAVLVLAAKLDLDEIGRRLAARNAAAPAAPAAPVAPDAASAQKANSLMAEADEFRAKGNFRGALEAVTEADRLVPNRPGILLQMASDQASLGATAEATALLKRIVALPAPADPAEAGFVAQARAALAQISNADAPPTTADAPPTVTPDKAGAGVRDEVGIPIGSVMGIVSVQLVEPKPGQKSLRVATKASTEEKIDPMKFSATVDFYEQDDSGQIQHADARQTEWMSRPVNWAKGEPELFQTAYQPPAADRGDLPPVQYHGYVVAIYYNGELQDSRAEPVSLLEQFPPPLTKSAVSE